MAKRRSPRKQTVISLDKLPPKMAEALVQCDAYFKKHPERRATEGPEKFLKSVLGSINAPNSAGRAFTDIVIASQFESDRGFVLVAASVIDAQLELIFRELFAIRSDATPDEMDFLLTTQPLPPLQSAAIKIRLAFALGIIDRQLMRALSKLQAIRSRVMAHSREVEWLTTDHALSIVDQLPASLSDDFHKMFAPANLKEQNRSSVFRKPRGRFMVAAMLLSSQLESARSDMRQTYSAMSSSGTNRTAQANTASRVSSDSDGHKTRNGSGT